MVEEDCCYALPRSVANHVLLPPCQPLRGEGQLLTHQRIRPLIRTLCALAQFERRRRVSCRSSSVLRPRGTTCAASSS